MRKIILLSFTCFVFLKLQAQQTSEQFNLPVNYLLYLPQGYNNDTTQRWPLMIFLHGSGESGSDIEKVKVHGPPKLIAQGKQFPCIVVSPQAGPSMQGWEPELMFKFLQDLKKRYRVDNDRIYLTGLSMGGYGTWNIAMKYPSSFAAIAPICGGGDTETISNLSHMPVWCFHGGKDNVVKPEESITLINALKKYNPSVRLTIYPEAGHDSWTETYNNDSLYTWLFAQKRFRHTRASFPEEKLKDYTGGYAQKGKDTADLIIDKGRLVVKQHPATEIIPYQENAFFLIEGDEELEIKFLRDKKGKVDRFTLFADKKRVFYKVR